MSTSEHNDSAGCCAPQRDGPGLDDPHTAPRSTERADVGLHDDDFVDISGGTFIMGTDEPYRYQGDGEGPAREVTLGDYRIARNSVTNAQFADFVEATDHRTEAERYGWSFVFHLFLPDDFPDTRAVASTPWWRQVYGADWAHPAGPQSNLEGLSDHPATHISWSDAAAYCVWAGVRLPTEAEWEMAARGGLVQKPFVWGDEFRPDGQIMCNIFDGTFPTENIAEDGYVGTSPSAAFPANGFGLHDMAGNVWEWCNDWFHTTFHVDGPRVDPQGPPSGEAKVMRGGSYLCHDSYCHRYRVAARSSNTMDSSAGNLGFRVAASSRHT